MENSQIMSKKIIKLEKRKKIINNKVSQKMIRKKNLIKLKK